MAEVGRLGRIAAGVLMAGCLVLGVAACGDDDEDDTTAGTDGTSSTVEGDDAPSTTDAEAVEASREEPSEEGTEGEGGPAAAQAASAEFCDGLVAFNQGVFSVRIEDGTPPEQVQEVGAQIIPLWDEVRNNAPEAHADDIEVLSAAIDPLAEGDASRFNADGTASLYGTFVGEAVGGCDFDELEVTAVDYAFEGVPATIAPGTLAVELSNASEGEEHEFVAFKKNDPAMTTEEIFALPEDQVESAITFAGAVSAPPGESATSLLTVEPGSYVAVCFLPVGGVEEGPPHFAEGMVTELTVQ